MGKKIESDILIIGAGPVGLFTVFEAGVLGLNFLIIDIDVPKSDNFTSFKLNKILQGFISKWLNFFYFNLTKT